jgi:neutral ceramidase
MSEPLICRSLLILLFVGPFASTGFAELRVGAAAAKITPPLGTPMAGYYHERGAEGVHDDLLAKALVFDDGATKAAIVVLDLISTSRWMVDEARTAVEKRTGIPGANVLISATHSHTGPVLAKANRRHNDFGGENPLAIRYMDELPGRIATVVDEALRRCVPVKTSFTVGTCEGIAFNRRFHMTDGSVGWNPGKLNPKIVRPAGPVDTDLPMVYFEGADAKPVATFMSYAIHLDTVGGAQFSADVPYTVSRLLAATKDENMLTVYATACCGDVNHVDVSNDRPQKGHAEAARIGTILAASALRGFEKLSPLSETTIRVQSRTVPLPLPVISPNDVTTAETTIARNNDPAEKTKPTFRELVKAYQTIDVAAQEGKPWDAQVQVITIGKELAFVSLPGEIFVELGMTIRRGSPFPCTAIAELANGSLGYIPNRVAYPQGNYEVISARVAEGSGEMLVDAALEMLRSAYAP